MGGSGMGDELNFIQSDYYHHNDTYLSAFPLLFFS